MNIVYSSDENYAQHTAVSIASLLSTNTEAEEINIYLISNSISPDTIEKVRKTCELYGRNFSVIDYLPYEHLLKSYATWHSMSAYARMFIASMLPKTCDRAIYLDCDTLIIRSLENLWNYDMHGAFVAGVTDTISSCVKKSIGFNSDDRYINTGALLIDLSKWRENNIQEQLISYLKEHSDMKLYQDQSSINDVLKGHIHILPPQYNAMTTFFTVSYKRMMAMYNLEKYYSEQEICEARAAPCIVHCTSGIVDRAWVKNSNHPFAKYYVQCRENTPWKDKPLSKSNLTKKDLLLRFLQKNLPIKLLKYL